MSVTESKTRGGKKIFKKKLAKEEETFERQKEPGVIYIGRLPWGLEERGLRDYFSQFGTVVRLRLGRSTKTGNSKQYAFVQFEHDEVAKIAAETMDNYLMFGKLIICKHIEDVHPKTFWGKKGPFKPDFRVKAIAKQNEGKSTDSLLAIKRRSLNDYLKKVEKLKQMGIEFKLEDMETVQEEVKKAQDAKEEKLKNMKLKEEKKMKLKKDKMKLKKDKRKQNKLKNKELKNNELENTTKEITKLDKAAQLKEKKRKQQDLKKQLLKENKLQAQTIKQQIVKGKNGKKAPKPKLTGKRVNPKRMKTQESATQKLKGKK